MTPTPEERAKQTVDALLRLPHFDEGEALASGAALIAQAIREAEDAALERAARLALNQVKFASDDWGQGHSVAAAGIANAIRALKHNKD